MENINVQEITNQLTIKEKTSLCSGKDFWCTKEVERLGIKSIMFSDGPHGLRKQNDNVDNLGVAESIKTTCFPTASALACTWNKDLMYKVGESLGEICVNEGVDVLLGPGMNIIRSPLCGRNFEYFSEDPYLSGEMATAFVNGVQSTGTGACIKHFAVNNQEHRRMSIDVNVDERALREIYLAGFEKVIKEANPWTVMCAYNKLQGAYCGENKRLLDDILREEWGYDGVVISDWGACNDKVESVKAGLDLEMPHCTDRNDVILEDAVKKGEIAESGLNKPIYRLMELTSKLFDSKKAMDEYDRTKSHKLARKAAAESIVLLKNEEKLLPIDKMANVCIVGELAEKPRYQGAGSSYVNSEKLYSLLDGFNSKGITYTYCKGYCSSTDSINHDLIKQAIDGAKNAEVVIVAAGLISSYESEGYDRKHINIPQNHINLIEGISMINENIIVVLQNGSPVSMPWIGKVKALLECYLGGQAGGLAIADILFGDENPSGKLAETFPMTLDNNMINSYFGMGPKTVEYRESVYVGYRYYDSANIDVLFPFGFGLSYTEYVYSNLKLSAEKIKDNEILEVSFEIENTGVMKGAETAQLFVKDKVSAIYRPEKELKGFEKIWLEAGEKRKIVIKLNKRAFAYYNVNVSKWHVESGVFEILIGASSRDICLTKKVYVESTDKNIETPDYSSSASEYYNIGKNKLISDSSFRCILDEDTHYSNSSGIDEFTMNSTLGDMSVTKVGRWLIKKTEDDYKKNLSLLVEDNQTEYWVENIVKDINLRNMILMGQNNLTYKRAKILLALINRKPVEAIKEVFS